MGLIRNQENYDKAYELVEKIKEARKKKLKDKVTGPAWLEQAKKFAATAHLD